jgi:hypothetical protein
MFKRLALLALTIAFAMGCDESDQGDADKSGWVPINGNNNGNGNNGSSEIITQSSDLLKSGTRLKHYVWKSDDGAQMIANVSSMFDTVLEKNCIPTSFESYGCDLAYCVPNDSSIEIINEFGKNIINYCNIMFDDASYDQSVAIGFYPESVSSNAVIIDGMDQSGNRLQLFSDPSCNNNFSGDFTVDNICSVKPDSFIKTSPWDSSYMTKRTSVCIDNSVVTYGIFNNEGPITTYYKPKEAKFTTLYWLDDTGACVKYHDRSIVIEEFKSIRTDDITKIAREERNKLCANVCDYIKQKATNENWAVIRKDLAD